MMSNDIKSKVDFINILIYKNFLIEILYQVILNER